MKLVSVQVLLLPVSVYPEVQVTPSAAVHPDQQKSCVPVSLWEKGNLVSVIKGLHFVCGTEKVLPPWKVKSPPKASGDKRGCPQCAHV